MRCYAAVTDNGVEGCFDSFICCLYVASVCCHMCIVSVYWTTCVFKALYQGVVEHVVCSRVFHKLLFFVVFVVVDAVVAVVVVVDALVFSYVVAACAFRAYR